MSKARLLTRSAAFAVWLSLSASAQEAEAPSDETATPTPEAEAAPAAPAEKPKKVPARRKVPKARPEPPAPTRPDAGVVESTTATIAPAPANDVEAVREEAKRFFSMLLSQDPRGLVEISALPFTLESESITTAAALNTAWIQALAGKDTGALSLRNIEVLTPAEMEARYGKPPARLATTHWNKAGTYLAVGNLSGRAAVVFFRSTAKGWKAVGFHD